MKKLVGSLLLFFTFQSGFAQTEADLWELVKSDLRSEYKVLLMENMVFSEEEASVFWPIFNAYMDKKNANLDERLSILKDYSESYATFTDDKLEELVKRSDAVRMNRIKIRTAYYKSLKKALGVRKAAKLYQIDSQINTLFDFQIASQVPIIE
jgi:hypothetical protein